MNVVKNRMLSYKDSRIINSISTIVPILELELPKHRSETAYIIKLKPAWENFDKLINYLHANKLYISTWNWNDKEQYRLEISTVYTKTLPNEEYLAKVSELAGKTINFI